MTVIHCAITHKMLWSTTVFRLSFNANTVEPKAVFTKEEREEWYRSLFRNPSAEEYEILLARHEAYKEKQRKDEQLRVEKLRDDLHAHYCKLAGGRTEAVMSITQAKRYVRARAADSLRAAFETLEHVIAKGSNAPLKDKLDVAYEILKRAAGPATAVSAVPDVKALAELAPVDAIDAVMKGYAAGDCDENFVKTLLGLLGAKVNGLKIEQELDRKSAAKVGDKIQKPPKGKVV